MEHSNDETIDALRARLDEQIDGTSRLVSECNAWRDKYRDLYSMYCNEKTKAAHAEESRVDEYNLRLEYQKEADKQEQRIAVLEESNKLLEDELQRKRSECAILDNKVCYYRSRVMELKTRGFWKRVFNS